KACSNCPQDRQSRAKIFYGGTRAVVLQFYLTDTAAPSKSTPSATGFLFAMAIFGQGELALRRSGFLLRRCLRAGGRRRQFHSDQFAHAAFFHGHAIKHVCLPVRAFV